MGAQVMDKKTTVTPLAGRCSSCEHPMVTNHKTLDKPFKGITLKMHNFRVRQCLNCGEETYGTGSLIRFGKATIDQFERNGDTDYICQYSK